MADPEGGIDDDGLPREGHRAAVVAGQEGRV
jgi:hypothetical protein